MYCDGWSPFGGWSWDATLVDNQTINELTIDKGSFWTETVNSGLTGFCPHPPARALDQILIFYDNGSFTYDWDLICPVCPVNPSANASPFPVGVVTCGYPDDNFLNEWCETEEGVVVGSTETIFENAVTGLYSIDGSMLTLVVDNASYAIDYEISGGVLTLDESLTGNTEYITIWGQQ